MAIANTTLNVTELDFFNIKENLKTYLRSQSVFTDFDFEGSGMSVLLDLLAYNTYYNNFYLNMVANESYLDTAQLRQNILSHAKIINYIPSSAQGAQARVNIRVAPSTGEDPAGTTNYLIMDKYTKLIGSDKNGVKYPFVTMHSNSAAKVASCFNFINVAIRQGEVMTYQWHAEANNTLRRFTIPSANVDTSTLEVRVQDSVSNTHSQVYTLATDLTLVTGDSPVYFLEENENLTYTIYFGDDIIGRKPANGNIIIATYLDTVGGIANGVQRFAMAEAVGGKFRDDVTVNTVTGAYAGADKETIEQIKFRAPHFYTTQNRAVTRNDYEALITKDFNDIEAVAVWGGEENDPPVYGKVYMSLKTKNYYALTNLEKDKIKNQLIANRNVLTVIPEIVDPNYTFVLVRGKITYNPSLTNKPAGELAKLVRNAILDYNNRELNSFKSTFKKSRLQYYIDVCDPSITGSDLKFYLQQKVPLTINQSKKYVVPFNTSLQKGTVSDKLYTFPEIILYDGTTNRNVFLEEIPSSLTGVDAVLITNPGYGYQSAPKIVISGDGADASAVAEIVNERIVSIKVTNPGVGYTQARVTIISDSGQEAEAMVKLQSRFGVLRAYYFKSTNGEKIIVSSNAGTVDYDQGVVTINNITPLSVVQNAFYGENIITVNVLPDNDIIPPVRNRILTIDQDNSQSILIEMVPET